MFFTNFVNIPTIVALHSIYYHLQKEVYFKMTNRLTIPYGGRLALFYKMQHSVTSSNI